MPLKAMSADEVLSRLNSDYGLVDRKVVFTGSMEKTRSEIETLAESIRMIPQKTVSKSTDLIVTGNNVGQAKLNASMKFGTPIIKFSIFINNAQKLQKYILNELNINDGMDFEFIKESVRKFPFIINFITKKLAKNLVTENPNLIKFLDNEFLDICTLSKMISDNGKIYSLLASDRKRNLNLIEAALFAKENPQITLCKKLIKAQIDVLDLNKASKKQKEYIWECYKLKLDTEDVIELAKRKKDLIGNTNNLKLR